MSRTPYGPFASVDDIERANHYAGQHYFEADTMRFFSSRVLSGVAGGRYFVTSERRGFDDYRRAYSVRVALDNGHVETVGDFLAFGSGGTAHRAAARCADAWPEVIYDPYEGASLPQGTRHYAWRVYVAGFAVGSRTTRYGATKLARELRRDHRRAAVAA